MKRALITGITGQDGSYLAEFLLRKGYEVHGIVRRSSIVQHRPHRPHLPAIRTRRTRGSFLHYGDLADGVGLVNLIRDVEPDEIYNLGAQSHVRVCFEIPEYTADVDRHRDGPPAGGDPRPRASSTRFYQASSREMYGAAPPPQTRDDAVPPPQPLRVREGLRATGRP